MSGTLPTLYQEVRTYENFVIIPQSYIIPSFQVRKGATPLTPTKPLGRFWLKRQKKNNLMAIYHLSTKPISRSSGRSAVASVAYRAGIKITDDRLGKTYDYTKRNGVLWTGMATPSGLEIDRNDLWNRAEKTETRSNSRTAREIVINIPHELMQGDQSAGKMLAYEFATNLSQKYKIAVDVAVHAPDKQGDNRNYHAHLLLTTRQITQEQDGRFELGKKSQLEMSNAQLKQAGLLSNQDELKEIRREWAELANEYLAERNIDTRIDHRSHKDRGLLTLPTVKMGWQATELERQGIRTEVGDQNRAIKAYNEQVLTYQAKQQRQEQTKRQTQLERAKTAQKPKTHENAQKGTLQSDKPKSDTTVPTTPPKPLQSENKAVSERFKLTSAEINQRHAFLAKFHEKIQELAKKLLNQELQALKDKAKPMLAKFEKLRDNEPLFLGKNQWRQDKQQALDRYNAVKAEHEDKRSKGVTAEHTKRVGEQLERDDPNTYRQAKIYMIELAKHEQTIRQEHAQSMGADEYAKPNQLYSGVIIQSDDKGTLQKTSSGIIYHSTKNLEVGKSYTLSHDEKTYTIQQDYEIRTKSQEQNLNKGR